jgi:prepilin-type N-terminal cleavage/methylation domain-containing protein
MNDFSSHPRRPPSGFVLLEVVLALAVFGMAATGFAVAMNRMGQAASLVQKELQITRILESTLDETLSLPVLEEGLTSVRIEDLGMDLETEIEILDELENENGQLLQEMYRITVTAHWFDAGQWQERMVETWRYGRLYQP